LVADATPYGSRVCRESAWRVVPACVGVRCRRKVPAARRPNLSPICALAYRKRVPERLNRILVCSILHTEFEQFYSLKGSLMNSIVYIVGLIVIVVAILSFLGLR
jgi:hypothetical protein